MPKHLPIDEDDTTYERSWNGLLDAAVQRAKQMRHNAVDPSHLLLAIIDAWPTLTKEVLAKAGIDGDDVPQRIIDCLNHQQGR